MAIPRPSISWAKRRRRGAETRDAEVVLPGQAEFRFRTLVEELPVGIYIDRPDVSCANIYSNPRIVEMLGYPLSAWIADPGFFAKIVHPDDRERVLGTMPNAISGKPFEDEYRLVAADGRVVWIWEAGKLVRDEQGEPLYVQGVMIDVTPRREAEERSRLAQQEYRSLVEHLPIVTYIEDANDRGRTVFVSPQMERLLGYPAERWLADRDFFFQVLHPDDVARLRSWREETEPERNSTVFRVVTRAGEERWVRSERVLVRDDEGRPLFVQGFWLDITEERRLEEQLRQRDRVEAVGRLAGGVAHDFNNLLMAVLGYAELAKGQLPPGSPVQESLDQVVHAATRGGELTRQLLTFSRHQAATPRAVDLNEAVREAEGFIARLIGETIVVRTDLAPDLPCVRVDPVQLQQILVNLAVNARDAMPDGGVITITTAASGGDVVLAVGDTGHGMDEQTRIRAFEPFFTTKSPGQGTGLGLATVHGIVTQAGGEIVLTSAPGAGTTLTIRLPGAAGDDDEGDDAGALRPGDETIVLIEDDELVRDSVRAMLASAGYRVIAPPTAADGIACAEAGGVDLVVSDVTMPETSGFEVAARLNATAPGLPVLLISGYAQADGQDGGRERHVLRKPFRAADITHAIRELLDERA